MCTRRGGGSTWTHSFLSTFPYEFRYETCTTCVYTQNNHISAKRTIKKCFVSKWRPKNEFSFREKSHVTKIWKTTFSKEFFNKIWLKFQEHEYNYIFEIKFEKNKKKKNKFCDIAQLCPFMLISGKMARPISIFFHQKTRNR